MRYASKRDLIDAIEANHRAFRELVASVPASRYEEPGVWGDGWTIKDLVAHLLEWQRMLMRWHRDGLEGRTPDMPAPGYAWRETPRLNRDIRAKHRGVVAKKALAEFDKSHREVLALARSLTSDELLKPGRFAWCGRLPLVSYLGANSASHYRTASGYIKRWLRKQRSEQPHH